MRCDARERACFNDLNEGSPRRRAPQRALQIFSSWCCLLAVLIPLLGLLLGCEFPSDPQVRRVSIVLNAQVLGDAAFSPNPIIVPWGGHIIWTNDDNIAHSIIGDAEDGPCAFKSDPFGPGKKFKKAFQKKVVCKYYCGLHGRDMRGRIEVE